MKLIRLTSLMNRMRKYIFLLSVQILLAGVTAFAQKDSVRSLQSVRLTKARGVPPGPDKQRSSRADSAAGQSMNLSCMIYIENKTMLVITGYRNGNYLGEFAPMSNKLIQLNEFDDLYFFCKAANKEWNLRRFSCGAQNIIRLE